MQGRSLLLPCLGAWGFTPISVHVRTKEPLDIQTFSLACRRGSFVLCTEMAGMFAEQFPPLKVLGAPIQWPAEGTYNGHHQIQWPAGIKQHQSLIAAGGGVGGTARSPNYEYVIKDLGHLITYGR